jgi:hypothetical protein
MRARGVSSYGGVASTIPKIIKKNLSTPGSRRCEQQVGMWPLLDELLDEASRVLAGGIVWHRTFKGSHQVESLSTR